MIVGEISCAQLQVMSLSEQRWSGVHHLLRDLEHAVARVPSREKKKRPRKEGNGGYINDGYINGYIYIIYDMANIYITTKTMMVSHGFTMKRMFFW